jgi:hypothetical protein
MVRLLIPEQAKALVEIRSVLRQTLVKMWLSGNSLISF